MKSSYSEDDVTILLKDISGMVEPLPTKVREARIQNGTHYCEMLPLESKPSEPYMKAYKNALKYNAFETAQAVGILAEKIYQKKGKELVIVSLARGGIPIGILIRRYLKNKYQADIPHYSISIIRGRGIDKNALDYILKRHKPEGLQFVDGWIGKGAILTQLKDGLKAYLILDNELGVVSDPANLTELCGTHEDILIPSSCLNAIVTGLISRTFLRDDVIGPGDFHGAAFYRELASEDISEEFLHEIEKEFVYDRQSIPDTSVEGKKSGLLIAREIAGIYGVKDINFVKPGIGETTRVLLRRVPWKVLINGKYRQAEELKHIFQLAQEKNVPWEISQGDLGNYKVCGIIKKLADI